MKMEEEQVMMTAMSLANVSATMLATYSMHKVVAGVPIDTIREENDSIDKRTKELLANFGLQMTDVDLLNYIATYCRGLAELAEGLANEIEGKELPKG